MRPRFFTYILLLLIFAEPVIADTDRFNDTIIGDTEALCMQLLRKRSKGIAQSADEEPTHWVEDVFNEYRNKVQELVADDYTNQPVEGNPLVTNLVNSLREVVDMALSYMNDFLSSDEENPKPGVPPYKELRSEDAEMRGQLIALMRNPIGRKLLVDAANKRLQEISKRTKKEILEGRKFFDVMVRGGSLTDAIFQNGLLAAGGDRLNILTVESDPYQYASNFGNKRFMLNSSNGVTPWGRRPVPGQGENLNYIPGSPIQLSDFVDGRYAYSQDLADLLTVLRALSGQPIIFGVDATPTELNNEVTDVDLFVSGKAIIQGDQSFETENVKVRFFANATGLGDEDIDQIFKLSGEASSLIRKGQLVQSDSLQKSMLNSSQPYRKFVGKDIAVIGGGNSADNIVEWLQRELDGLYYGEDRSDVGYPNKVYWYNPRFPKGLTPENCKDYSANSRVRYCFIAEAIKKGVLVVINNPRVTNIKSNDNKVVVTNSIDESVSVDYVITAIGRKDRADIKVGPDFGSIVESTDSTGSNDANLNLANLLAELRSLLGSDFSTSGSVTQVSPDGNRAACAITDPQTLEKKFRGAVFSETFAATPQGTRITEELVNFLGLDTNDYSRIEFESVEAINSPGDDILVLKYLLTLRGTNRVNDFSLPITAGRAPELFDLLSDGASSNRTFYRRPLTQGGTQIATLLSGKNGEIYPYGYIGPAAKVSFTEEEQVGVDANGVSNFLNAGKTYRTGQYVVDLLSGMFRLSYGYGEEDDENFQQENIEGQRVVNQQVSDEVKRLFSSSPLPRFEDVTLPGSNGRLPPLRLSLGTNEEKITQTIGSSNIDYFLTESQDIYLSTNRDRVIQVIGDGVIRVITNFGETNQTVQYYYTQPKGVSFRDNVGTGKYVRLDSAGNKVSFGAIDLESNNDGTYYISYQGTDSPKKKRIYPSRLNPSETYSYYPDSDSQTVNYTGEFGLNFRAFEDFPGGDYYREAFIDELAAAQEMLARFREEFEKDQETEESTNSSSGSTPVAGSTAFPLYSEYRSFNLDQPGLRIEANGAEYINVYEPESSETANVFAPTGAPGIYQSTSGNDFLISPDITGVVILARNFDGREETLSTFWSPAAFDNDSVALPTSEYILVDNQLVETVDATVAIVKRESNPDKRTILIINKNDDSDAARFFYTLSKEAELIFSIDQSSTQAVVEPLGPFGFKTNGSGKVPQGVFLTKDFIDALDALEDRIENYRDDTLTPDSDNDSASAGTN